VRISITEWIKPKVNSLYALNHKEVNILRYVGVAQQQHLIIFTHTKNMKTPFQKTNELEMG